jgi:2-hydroxychromene-2-carboxylate isomerase
MSTWQGNMGAELRHEVAVVQRLAPGLPITLPPGKPNTQLVIEEAARLLHVHRERGMEFVRQAYRSFWCNGRDLSDPSIVEGLVRQVGGSIEQADLARGMSKQVAQQWEEAWHATDQAGVPLILSPDGRLLVGYVPAEDIRRFMS